MKSTLPNLLYDDSVTLIPEREKDITRKETTGQFPDEYRCKNLNKILANQNLTAY